MSYCLNKKFNILGETNTFKTSQAKLDWHCRNTSHYLITVEIVRVCYWNNW